MKPRIKICGITRADDALLACELGASAIGFVFWPRSPRFVDPARARAIVDALPPFVVCVGVFADQRVEEVGKIAEAARLGAVQLHGQETVAEYEVLRRPLIRAVPVRTGMTPSTLAEIPPSVSVLLDAHDSEKLGGTGRTIDWLVAAGIAAARPVILSGGLRPENIAEAIRTVGPAAVDVASGVEREPGVKDPARLKAFFQAVAATPET